MEGDCHFLTGNLKAKKRVAYIRKMLDEMGLEQDRVQMFNIAASDAPEFARVAKAVTEKIRALGPNPIKGTEAEARSSTTGYRSSIK
jgi:F420-non-reducing hydrogenase iron-sulfur subunit